MPVYIERLPVRPTDSGWRIRSVAGGLADTAMALKMTRSPCTRLSSRTICFFYTVMLAEPEGGVTTTWR